jgi:mannose-6-phosphate isomerase-like protein (cupin superfamily)
MPIVNVSELEDGNLRGADYGATVCVIPDRSEPGHGPPLHRHPYDEVWFVLEGNVTFEADGERIDAGPSDFVIVPPEAPHKFTNNGPGRSNLVCIHSSPTFVTEWLE